jgi:hypothetical protein
MALCRLVGLRRASDARIHGQILHALVVHLGASRCLAQPLVAWLLALISTMLEVLLAVQQSGVHHFVTRVGHENEPWYRIRRSVLVPPTCSTDSHCILSANGV